MKESSHSLLGWIGNELDSATHRSIEVTDRSRVSECQESFKHLPGGVGDDRRRFELGEEVRALLAFKNG